MTEYGKVHGPYNTGSGHEFVIVLKHNVDGSIKSRQTIPYQRYLKEVDNGEHNYCSYPKQIKLQPPTKWSNNLKQPFKVHCLCCKKEYFTNSNRGELLGYVCSKNCREKLRRKNKRKQKLLFHNQAVITINEKELDKYYIVYELTPGNRTSYFIKASNCKIHITEDKNSIVLYNLVYDLKDCERIKTVKDYKKYFWITESGILVSRRTRKILSQTINEEGYLTHSTKIGGRKGKNKCFRIHRLVAEAFINNPLNKPEVNHINCIKTDNKVVNLEWNTSKENTQHAILNGLIHNRRGEDVPTASLTNLEAEEIRKLYSTGNYSQYKLADMYNVGRTVITSCVNMRTYKS